jgi:hypothetical protein
MKFNTKDELIAFAKANAGKMCKVTMKGKSWTGRISGYATSGFIVIEGDDKKPVVDKDLSLYVWLIPDACHGWMYTLESEFEIVDSPKVSLNNLYPHSCPTCRSPAYIGFQVIECSSHICRPNIKG